MFFDLSLPEIVVLLGLGVVLLGPDKLPQAAAGAARFLRQVRAFSDSTREGLHRELGPEFDGLDLKDLNPKTFVRKNLLGETDDLRALRDELDQDLRGVAGTSPGSVRGTSRSSIPAPIPPTTAPAYGRPAKVDQAVLAVGERPAFDVEAT